MSQRLICIKAKWCNWSVFFAVGEVVNVNGIGFLQMITKFFRPELKNLIWGTKE